MLSLLPDLAPRDSHSLWYTSSRSPLPSHDLHQHNTDNTHPHAPTNQRRNQHVIDRSPLARLRADEQNLERRLHNVSNFGSTWLKPPGIPKTLHQLREERREQDEHQEALRREQLAQELADAEATGGADAIPGGPGDPDAVMNDVVGSDVMDDVQLDGARDLDDDVPEADDDFGISIGSEDSDDDDSEESDEDEGEERGATPAGAVRAERLQQNLMTQMMRRHDQFREGIALGGDEEVDEEDQEQMIEEEDAAGGEGDDVGMDVDLDDDIPEAESEGGYEHTDTEAELTSSDDDQAEMSFAAARAPQTARFRGSLARSDATRNSIAISDILSRDGSSLLGSSPQLQRRI
ncbi:Apc15p protein-domain-containing protein [Xylariales sp. AK1849]|nr:Apc15p protein-domain-containing protein [Xylariales sp. AK1849]